MSIGSDLAKLRWQNKNAEQRKVIMSKVRKFKGKKSAKNKAVSVRTLTK